MSRHNGHKRWRLILTLTCLWLLVSAPGMELVSAAESSQPSTDLAATLRTFCYECHDADSAKGGLNFEALDPNAPAARADVWEKVVQKLAARHMPPIGRPRPDEGQYEKLVRTITAPLDAAAARNPQPGHTESLRRLNRTEYRNAIRDLLGLSIDTATLLPKDDSAHGFDHVTVGDLSPTLLERYLAAAEKISRLAVGTPDRSVGGETFRLRPDLTQEAHTEGLPLGTRGGATLQHTFPQDGEYEVQVRLTRDRNEEIEGLREEHELEVLLDGEVAAHFVVTPPKGHRNFERVDAHLNTRIRVSAGPHQLGVTFVKLPSSLAETRRQPYAARFNMHRHPRLNPAVYQISLVGPFQAGGPGDSPSRRRLFVCRPTDSTDEETCARQILGTLARRAFRRSLEAADLDVPMRQFREVRRQNGFEAGIEAGVAAVLMSPAFLFHVEVAPPGVTSGGVYPVSDSLLASRLSFFLWSSIPDDELLAAAERGELHQPAQLAHQARRMLADPRARNLVENFAGQWLHLRNLDSIVPDLRLFPDFDDNLRQAFREETERFVDSVWREDRSVLDLLRANYTFLNERLARHYGLPHVVGSQFRRVTLAGSSERGGLLRQGSILTVTSYATRTSPVLRGNWILANLLGLPAPPPPANVPALKENTVAANLPVRARLAEHRANPACASCHNLMDPVGFALENYDAIGRFRLTEDGEPIDANGALPDGRTFTGVAGLEEGLCARPELFLDALASKLLTFALGRGVEPTDAPALRAVVRDTRAQGDRFSALIVSLVQSPPFTLRKAP